LCINKKNTNNDEVIDEREKKRMTNKFSEEDKRGPE
jgi:hypothetical protein